MFGHEPIVVGHLLAAGLTGAVAWRSLRHRHVPGAAGFGVAMAAVAAWASLAAAELLVGDSPVVLSLLYRLEWTPIGVLGVAWLAFALAYGGRGQQVTRRRVVALSVVPGVVALAALCHGLLIQRVQALAGPLGGVAGVLWAVESVWTPVQTVGTAYVYLLVGAGSVLLLETLARRPASRRGAVLLVGVVGPPWVLNALHLFVLEFRSFDPTVLGFVVSGAAGLFAVGRFRPFEVPLARTKVVDALDSAVVVYGRDGRIYDFNERASSLLALDREDFGTDVRDALADPPLRFDPGPEVPLFPEADDPEPTFGNADRTARSPETAVDGGATSLSARLDGAIVPLASEGDPDYLEGRVSTLSDGSNRPISRVLRLYDVTDRERRKRELERSRDRYRALFENNQVVFWEFDLSATKAALEDLDVDPEGLVAYFDDNPAEFERLLDTVEVTDVNERSLEFYAADSRQQLVSRLGDLLTEESVATWKRLLARIAAGETTFRAECTTGTFDGETKTVLSDMIVPETHEETYDRVYLTALDVTERRRRREELRRKNEFLDEFASVVSHDVSTPLNVIENKARLIEMTDDPDHAADIYEATGRVQALVDQLETLAQQGKEVGDTDPVSLERLAREAWHGVETDAATLVIDSSCTLVADRDRLRQLLENLLRNAVEHGSTSPGSRARQDAVEHGSTSPDSQARRDAVEHGSTNPATVRVGVLADGFYVADDGPGVPERDRDRVFEQGFTTDDDGTGLGLAIVRRIAEGHGWTVSVTEADSGGARFEVRTDD